jgi:hypothetical protein
VDSSRPRPPALSDASSASNASNASNPSEAGDAVTDLKLVEPSSEADALGDDRLLGDLARSRMPSRGREDASVVGSEGRSVPVWMLIGALILAVIVIGWQAQLAGELEAEIVGLEGRLDRAQSLVEAHRSHLGEIRGGVYDLSDRIDGLRALIESGPIDGPSDSPPPAP